MWTDGRNNAIGETGIGETDIFTDVERPLGHLAHSWPGLQGPGHDSLVGERTKLVSFASLGGVPSRSTRVTCKDSYGSDGTRTRDLRRDRLALLDGAGAAIADRLDALELELERSAESGGSLVYE